MPTMMRDATISFPMLGDWSIDPSASFTLFGHTFYWYGAIIAVGFILAMLYCARHCRRCGIKPDTLYDFLIWMIPLAIIGARLYYAPGLLIGQCIGRWGNFINREAFGRETAAFSRMGLTLPGRETVYVHPTFLYESLWNFAGFLMLHFWFRKHERRFDGELILLYAVWYGIGRALIEGLRTDSLYITGTGIRVSQLLAGVSAAAATVVLALLYTGKLRHPPRYVDRESGEAQQDA